MKKLIITTTSLALLLATSISCNKIKDKLDNVAKTSQNGNFGVNTGDEADDIIKFNNKIVRLDDKQRNYISQIEKALFDMTTYVDKALKTGNTDFAPMFIITSLFSYDLKDIKAPKILGNEYQILITEMETSFAPILEIQEELKLYKEAQDWKDDKGKKLQELHAKLKSAIDKNRKIAEELFIKMEPKAAMAEEDILKDHPYKKQLMQSKEALTLSNKIIDEVYSTKNINSLKLSLEKQYNDLEAISKRNSATEFPSKYKNKETSYKNFNRSVEEFLGEIRIAKRTINEKSNLNEDELQNLDEKYNYVLDAYNSFVD